MDTKETKKQNLLGETIRSVRKAKGITQEHLGKKVGLGKSGISKIENGITYISAEEASFLLEAMGEKLEISVSGTRESAIARKQKATFMTTGVLWFATAKNLTAEQSYRYLLLYKGINFMEDNYIYEQTLPKETILSDLTRVCNMNGGNL